MALNLRFFFFTAPFFDSSVYFFYRYESTAVELSVRDLAIVFWPEVRPVVALSFGVALVDTGVAPAPPDVTDGFDGMAGSLVSSLRYVTLLLLAVEANLPPRSLLARD